METKQGVNPKAFYGVLALLEEEDVEIPQHKDKVLKTIDGHTWGVKRTDDPHFRLAQFERRLGLGATVIEDLSEERSARGTEAEKQAMLTKCQRVVNTGSTHSMFSRFAQAIGAYLAEDLAEGIEARWLEDHPS